MTDTTTTGFQPAGPAGRIRRITYGDETELAGLVIRIGGLSIDEWMTHSAYERALPLFVDRLVEWNWLDPDGAPVPATADGVKTLDAALIKTVVSDWFERATGVVPLGRRPRAEVASVPPPPGADPAMEATLAMLPVS